MVGRFAEAVRPVAGVLGFSVGGSLAAGDYQPGISDLDLVAVVAGELAPDACERLTALHLDTMDTEPGAAKPHCAYLPRDQVSPARDERAALARQLMLDGIATVVSQPQPG